MEDGTRLDASACTSDYDETFFAEDGLSRLADWLKASRDANG
jgi:hypothetical protein